MTTTKAPKKAAAKKAAAPSPPTFGGSLTIDAALLKRIIETVAPAASTDEARPMLCQLHVEPGATTEFVATDSYRLHAATVHTEQATGTPANIPAWWLRRWAKIKQTRNAVVTLTWTETDAAVRTATISVDTGDVTETIRLLSAADEYRSFPDWRPLLVVAPDATSSLSAFNPKLLAAALAACARWSADWRPVLIDYLRPSIFESIHSELGKLRVALMSVRTSEIDNKENSK